MRTFRSDIVADLVEERLLFESRRKSSEKNHPGGTVLVAEVADEPTTI